MNLSKLCVALIIALSLSLIRVVFIKQAKDILIVYFVTIAYPSLRQGFGYNFQAGVEKGYHKISL